MDGLVVDYSQEEYGDPIALQDGSNQIIPQGRHHFVNTTPRSNRVQTGQLPRTGGPSVGAPNKVNPAGRGLGSDSLQG